MLEHPGRTTAWYGRAGLTLCTDAVLMQVMPFVLHLPVMPLTRHGKLRQSVRGPIFSPTRELRRGRGPLQIVIPSLCWI